MTIFLLRVLAMGTMLIDHVAGAFFGNPMWMRTIGRIAFPCYAFLLAEGFRHSKNSDKRLSAQLSKLVVLAFVSEFCYDLLEFGFDLSEYCSSQNNIITLLLAYLGLLATEKWRAQPLNVAITYALTAFLNYVCASNYRFAGVLLVYALYAYLNGVMQPAGTESDDGILLRRNADGRPVYGYWKRYGMLLGIVAVYIPIYHMALNSFVFGQSLIADFVTRLPWYVMHIAIAAILALYNGQLGYKKPWFSAAYSWFYPAHLFVLGTIRLAFVN